MTAAPWVYPRPRLVPWHSSRRSRGGCSFPVRAWCRGPFLWSEVSEGIVHCDLLLRRPTAWAYSTPPVLLRRDVDARVLLNEQTGFRERVLHRCNVFVVKFPVKPRHLSPFSTESASRLYEKLGRPTTMLMSRLPSFLSLPPVQLALCGVSRAKNAVEAGEGERVRSTAVGVP